MLFVFKTAFALQSSGLWEVCANMPAILGSRRLEPPDLSIELKRLGTNAMGFFSALFR